MRLGRWRRGRASLLAPVRGLIYGSLRRVCRVEVWIKARGRVFPRASAWERAPGSGTDPGEPPKYGALLREEFLAPRSTRAENR